MDLDLDTKVWVWGLGLFGGVRVDWLIGVVWVGLSRVVWGVVLFGVQGLGFRFLVQMGRDQRRPHMLLVCSRMDGRNPTHPSHPIKSLLS